MLKRIRNAFMKDTEFMKRIKHRHYSFWKDPDREKINHTQFSSSCPIEVLQKKRHWQRRLSNKYNSREFAKKYGCQVPDLYWKGRNIRDIDFEKLPLHYVVKPTIGSGSQGIWLMSQGVNLFDKEKWPKEKLLEAMDQIQIRREKLEFLIEEFVKTEDGTIGIPVDYKIFTFNGAIACIEVINRTSPQTGTQFFYDENWNGMKPLNRNYLTAKYQQPPECLEDMLYQTRKLSKAYEIFVRIDFYASDKGAVFGEFAPTPSLGGSFTSYGSDLLVSYWDKYCNGKI